jgi:hypothetical protein
MRMAALVSALLLVVLFSHPTPSPARWYLPTVRIWIAPDTLPDRSAEDSINVKDAFEVWESTTRSPHFVFVAHEREANIVVRWVPDFSALLPETLSGQTTFVADSDDNRIVINTATITIAMRTSSGLLLSDWDRHALLLHEIGHALGLSHVNDPSSIMNPIVYIDYLSTADKCALDTLYH